MRSGGSRWVLVAGLVFLGTTTLAQPGGKGKAKPARPAVPITGKASPALASFDRMLTTFLPSHGVPGAALAVGRHGKVVYARGFGYADREAKRQVQPQTLFRIASVTKPLTAVAILQLMERGKLRLDQHVFDLLKLQAPKKGFDPRWKKVTVRHLLTHRGGWNRDRSFDPMFMSPTIVKELNVKPPAMPPDIIRFMLGKPLDFEPGSKEVYSNFGYCLLGRVVEKVSGQPYEQYVKQHILAPLGIRSMRIGHTLKPAPGEVKYYDGGKGRAIMGPSLGKMVPWPYGGWCLEAMDSHGGWIASAPDLVRFALALDDPARSKILKPKTVQLMFAPPMPGQKNKPSFYAMGWDVRPNMCQGKPNTWHSGSLDGTSTMLVRRCDGLTWAVLFNTRKKTNKEEPADAVDPLIHKAADEVKRWP
jgi:N-acyl-D-amino-acid deacylase